MLYSQDEVENYENREAIFSILDRSTDFDKYLFYDCCGR